MSRPSAGARAGLATTLAAGLVLAALAPAGAQTEDAPPSAEDIPDIVAGMSIDQLIGQMTWTHVYGDAADDTSMSEQNQERYGVDTPAEVVERFELGGVLYFAWSNEAIVNDPVAAAELSNGLQAASLEAGSGIPLATTIDQEGGIVARMLEPVTALPGNMALGATFDTDLARAQGEILGSEMAAVGINVDFAPVVDVNTNPDNPVIGVRSMGEDPQWVADLGVAQVDGIQSQGVAAAAKHFPGHGDTDVDSHTGLPIVDYDGEVFEQHLQPFRAAIDAGVDMIMTAHVIVEAADPEMPGTLSYDVLTGLLRDELGFEGLVTTDALDMDALKHLPDNPLDDGEIAVLAIQAGSDILLMSPDVPATFEAVNDAVEDGEITRERLEESVTRILEWKLERDVWVEDPSVPVDEVMDVVGNDEHHATAQQIADRSLTLLRNEDGVLPLGDETSVFVTGWGTSGVPNLTEGLIELGLDATAHPAADPDEDAIAEAVAAAEDHDVIVVMTHSPGPGNLPAYLDALIETDVPVIHVPMRNPYDVNWALADAQIATYSYQAPTMDALARALVGDVNPSGALPVNVPTADGEDVLYPLGFGLSYEDEEPTEEPTDPGTEDPTDPGTEDPTDPGSEDPTDPGSEDPGSEDPTDPGAEDPGAGGDGGGTLPDTGAAVGWFAAAAVLLLAAGAAIVLRRRRA